ncbi:hypothetical protein BBP40_011107 [Aspergillus hancockii]|nr:hypothetical protein BBP40_011107 [Aspergillus hancockii]
MTHALPKIETLTTQPKQKPRLTPFLPIPKSGVKRAPPIPKVKKFPTTVTPGNAPDWFSASSDRPVVPAPSCSSTQNQGPTTSVDVKRPRDGHALGNLELESS